MSTDYLRVIPRDLFNESKLLKCLGRLALLHLDGMLGYLRVEMKDPRAGFQASQNNDGELYCGNVVVSNYDDSILDLHTPLNSKEVYPLIYRDADWNEMQVFYEDGQLTDEFYDVCHGKPRDKQ